MTFSLRHLTRSRALWVLSAVAWLMLATTSLMASPTPSAGVGGEHAQAVAMAHHHDHCKQGVSHPVHAAFSCCHDHDDKCCQGSMGLACQCASLCGTALAAVMAYVVPSFGVVSIHHDQGAARTQELMLHPPLRPPVA